MNYYKFEEKIIEVIKKVCKIYVDRNLLEETYKRHQNKTTDMIQSVKKAQNTTKLEITSINQKLDQLYEDKLNHILSDTDFMRISKKYIEQREKLEEKNTKLQEQITQLQRHKKNTNNEEAEKLDKLIEEFLQLEEIDKNFLFRLIDKIEIDKDKNVFISFNFSKLNIINENIEEYIEIEKILENKEKVG